MGGKISGADGSVSGYVSHSRPGVPDPEVPGTEKGGHLHGGRPSTMLCGGQAPTRNRAKAVAFASASVSTAATDFFASFAKA
jgi:hypothetical protein